MPYNKHNAKHFNASRMRVAVQDVYKDEAMHELVQRIANGTTQLIGSDEICHRIGVPRTTFDQWVSNGKSEKDSGGGILGALERATSETMKGLAKVNDDGMSFPPPDIYIGKSPKWEMETFNNWLKNNLTTTSTDSK